MKKNETLEGLMKQYGFNEADLLDNAKMMGLNANHEWDSLKRTELRKRVASEVLSHPKEVLSRLPIEDLRLLQILKDAEPGMGMKSHQTTQMVSMAMLGLAEQVETGDDEFEFISITEDFKKAIRPYVDEVLDDFEVRFRIYVEQIAIGAMNLYGVLTERELKNILKDCMELEDDGTGVLEHIYPQSVVLQMQRTDGYFGDGEDFFTSPFVDDFGYVMQEQKKRKETATLKPFDVEDIKEAGGMPVPCIPNAVSEKLLNMLESKLGFTEQETYYWEFMLWRLVQEEDTQLPAIIQKLMDAVSPKNCPKGIHALNDVVQVVMEFLNHAPRWIFRGRCPGDLRQSAPPMTSAPQITIGPNMRRMGYRQEDVQQQVNDIWEQERESFMTYVAPPRVGRNDPCPCGSGKKYKNCCGRGN